MKDLLLLFRNNGWHWEGPLLVDVIRTLQAQGVADSTALISLDLNDVAGAELWPTEAFVVAKCRQSGLSQKGWLVLAALFAKSHNHPSLSMWWLSRMICRRRSPISQVLAPAVLCKS